MTLNRGLRLSLVICPKSFRMGFEPLSEASLRALQLPAHFSWWSSLGQRVFESSGLSLQCSSLSRVPTPVSRMFLCLRPSRCRSPIPSLAPSWWSPCPLWRRALLTLSCYVLSVPSDFFFASFSFVSPVRIVAPLVPCLSWRYPSFARSRSCGWGVSPCIGFRRSPWGSRWLHLYRLTPTLVRIHGLEVRPLGLWSVFNAFTCETFRKYSWRLFSQFTWFIRVPAWKVPWGCAIGTHDVTSDWVDLGSPSSHFQDSVDSYDWWSRQTAPEASSNRHSVAVALSSSL